MLLLSAITTILMKFFLTCTCRLLKTGVQVHSCKFSNARSVDIFKFYISLNKYMHTFCVPSYIHIWNQFIENYSWSYTTTQHSERNSYQACVATTVSCCRSYVTGREPSHKPWRCLRWCGVSYSYRSEFKLILLTCRSPTTTMHSHFSLYSG